MAKIKKKKKTAVVQTQRVSPERRIKEGARKLPIGKCYMRSDFKEASICSLVVTRKMGSHYIVGIYLVDTGCLGLKNTSYRFDYDEDDLEGLIDDISLNEDLQECSYVEVHNFIYGAIAYSEELGFEPEKDWKISQYILEEDSDDIELIEYEFGKDGKPFYLAGPFDNTTKIIATLNRNIGEGNYHYLLPVGGFNDFADDDFDNDDDDEYWLAEEIQDVAEEIGFEEEDIEKFDFEVYLEPLVIDYKQGISQTDLNKIEAIAMKAIYMQKANSQDIQDLKKFIEKYPQHPPLYNYLTSVYAITNQIANAEATIFKTVELFPDYLYGKISYAETFFVAKNPDEAIMKAFNGHLHLSDLYPNRDEFQINEFAAFYFAIMRYYIEKNDAKKAKMYLDLLEAIAPDESHTKNAKKIYDNSQKKSIFRLW